MGCLHEFPARPVAGNLLHVLFFSLAVMALTSSGFAQRSGCSLGYDGLDDQVVVPSHPALPDDVFTVTAWIRTSSQAAQALVARGEDDVTDVQPWGFGLVSGRLYLQIEELGNNSLPLYSGSTRLDDGRWHHVAVTRDGSGTAVLYLDGVIDASFSTGDPGTTTEDLCIGFSYQSGGTSGPQPPTIFVDGYLDEVMLWTSALAPADIVDVMNGTLTSGPSLLGHWKMDEGSGQVAGDSSGAPVLDGVLGTSSVAEAADPEWCCPDVTSYCTPGTTSSGCRASIAGVGVPSASDGSGFDIVVSQMEGNKQGILFYGISGPKAAPWGSGTSYLCIKAPTQRTPVQSSGGTSGSCDGSMSLDWNAYIAVKPNALGNPFAGGETVWAQYWFRDPPSPKTTSLSDALEFTVCP